MAIKTFRFLDADHFLEWDEIDPTLTGNLSSQLEMQPNVAYNTLYINQALSRASDLINRFGNKKGRNYLKKNWELWFGGFDEDGNVIILDPTKTDLVNDILLAICKQTQHYLINGTYYEENDTNYNQGGVSVTSTQNKEYFILPEVLSILKYNDLYLDTFSNNTRDELNKPVGNIDWITNNNIFHNKLTIADGDARYIKKDTLVSGDGSIAINKQFNGDIDLKVNAYSITGIGIDEETIKVDENNKAFVNIDNDTIKKNDLGELYVDLGEAENEEWEVIADGSVILEEGITTYDISSWNLNEYETEFKFDFYLLINLTTTGEVSLLHDSKYFENKYNDVLYYQWAVLQFMFTLQNLSTPVGMGINISLDGNQVRVIPADTLTNNAAEGTPQLYYRVTRRVQNNTLRSKELPIGKMVRIDADPNYVSLTEFELTYDDDTTQTFWNETRPNRKEE